MTIIAARRKNGSQVLMAAPQLTYFPGEIEYLIQTPVERLDSRNTDLPWTNIRRARVTMFHLVEPSYSMLLRALAT